MVEKKEAKEKEVGKISHYYSHLGVGVVELSGTLKKGDKIHIKGATSDFTQNVVSMQIEHDKVEEAKKGQSIGMKVKDHVREHDAVFLVK
ncbi:translation elongation factor-like protein [Candidatus Woesearchaeota archaeon]|nr:translation elongation factor-like protein [Candidatus Woesearchaeota archaeon]